jgi:hypothetical protein
MKTAWHINYTHAAILPRNLMPAVCAANQAGCCHTSKPYAACVAQVTPYQTDEVVVILPANHPLAGETTIDVDQLYSLQFVSLHKSTTVQGIRAILEAHSICWTGLNVVMVRLLGSTCPPVDWPFSILHAASN